MNYLKTGILLAGLTALFMAVGFLVSGTSGMFIAFLIVAGMNIFAYWNSDKIVLRMHHAKEVNTNHPLYLMVTKLAQSARLPMPKVYIIDIEQPNAFATGVILRMPLSLQQVDY